MKDAREIIIRPIITERSGNDAAIGCYTFEVALKATKPEISRAVEELFGVKVLSVNTMNLPGKIRRRGATVGRTARRKKALVTIDLNPVAETYHTAGGKEVSTGRRYKTSIDEFGFAQ
ncbi:MAG: 50S ribosomal protein L23 [Clostridiaceae bacterium]|nr:50S ribosomal protein L23 [Clostridiaceae bacterium]